MPTTVSEGLPTEVAVQPCSCGCSHKTLAELLNDTCECGCDCHSKERLDAMRSAAELRVGTAEPGRPGDPA